MRRSNIVIAVLVSLLVCVFVLNSYGIARSGKSVSPAKVVVVDMEKVILQSKKNQKFEEAFKAYTEKAQEEIQEIEEQIKMLRDSLKPLKPSSEDYIKRSSALAEKEMLVEVKRRYYQQDLPRRRQIWIEQAYGSVAQAIEKIAKANDYDIVLPKEGKKVLYNAEKLEITDEVLAAWDASN